MTTNEIKALIGEIADIYFPMNEGTGATAPIEALGTYTVTGAAYNSVSWTSTNILENAYSGTRPATSGSAGSSINLGNLGGIGSRISTAGGFSLAFAMSAGSQTQGTRDVFVPMMGYQATSGASKGLFKFGRATGSPNRFDLSYTVDTTNVSSSGTISAYRDIVDLLTGDYPYTFGITYSHDDSVFNMYVNGIFWATSSTANVTGSNYLRGVATVDFTNFMLGAFSFNGSTTGPFAATFCGAAAGAGRWNEREHRRIHELMTQKYPLHQTPRLSGSNAIEITSARGSAVSGPRRVIGFEGDSTMAGFLPEIADAIKKQRDAHIANVAFPLGDDSSADDTYAPARYSQLLTSGSTVTRLFTTSYRNSRYERGSNVIGLGTKFEVTGGGWFDLSQGMTLDVVCQKKSGSGSLTVKVYGSNDLINANDAVVTTYWETVLDTTISAADLTGTAGTFVTKSFDVPNAHKWNYLRLDIAAVSATVNVALGEWVSVASSDRTRLYDFARGGKTLANYNTTYPGRTALYNHLGITDIICNFGLNDGLSVSADTFATQFDTYQEGLFDDIATLQAVDYVATTAKAIKTQDSNNLPTAWTNHRTEQYPGAIADWADANTDAQVAIHNARSIYHEHYGWNEVTQSTLGYTKVTHSASATITSGQVYEATYAQAGSTPKKYFLALQNGTAGLSLTDENYFNPIARFTTDGTHHTDYGTVTKMDTAAQMILGDAATSTDSSTGDINVTEIGTYAPGATIDYLFESFGAIDLSSGGYTITVYRNSETTGEDATLGTATATQLPYTYTLPETFTSNDKARIKLFDASGTLLCVQVASVLSSSTGGSISILSDALDVVSQLNDTDEPRAIYKGRIYTVDYTFPDYTGDVTDGETLTLRVMPLDSYEDVDATETLALIQTTATATLSGTTLTATFTFTAEQTGALPAGAKGDGATDYRLQVLPAGNKYLLTDRVVEVRRAMGTPA